MPDTTTIRINNSIYKELKRIADFENETIQILSSYLYVREIYSSGT
jgi:predicted DNA-binding ribbon-helix-helix protein